MRGSRIQVFRIIYAFALALLLISWMPFALEGDYREILDDLPAICILAAIWGATEACYEKCRSGARQPDK